MSNTILFFGDSITAAGQSDLNSLGNGFVFMVSQMLSAQASSRHIEVINSGINGHTVQDLLSRCERDVMAYSPEIVLIKIGINDAYNDYINIANVTRLNQYMKDYRRLLNQLKQELPASQILLLTPYCISDDSQDEFYLRMADYTNVVIQLGEAFELPVLNTQFIFDEAVRRKGARYWAEDQIHPIEEGHSLLAKGVFNFLMEFVNLAPTRVHQDKEH